MSDHETLGKVVSNELFTEIDFRLRRGVHISIEDVEFYDFIKLNFGELCGFYSRYECDLKEGAEGYFYLVSNGAVFGQRQLTKGEMLIALTIAHLYRDPENRVRGTGELGVEQIISRLEALKSKEDIAWLLAETRLKAELHPSRVREAVCDAVRKLAGLNFLQITDSNPNRFRCKRPIHRFDQFVAQLAGNGTTENSGAEHAA
jgi:chromosome partition protein MukE